MAFKTSGKRRNYESIKPNRNYIFYLVHATTERKEFMIWDLISKQSDKDKHVLGIHVL